MKRIALCAALLAAACKCTPTPTVAHAGFDAGPIGSSYTAACGHLAELGCVEGQAFDCASTLQKADRDKLTLVPIACIVAAKTKADVQGCGGFVKCP